jgi:hypothetical protein
VGLSPGLTKPKIMKSVSAISPQFADKQKQNKKFDLFKTIKYLVIQTKYQTLF